MRKALVGFNGLGKLRKQMSGLIRQVSPEVGSLVTPLTVSSLGSAVEINTTGFSHHHRLFFFSHGY